MPVCIKKPGYFEIVFNCHSKGCLAILKYKSGDSNMPAYHSQARDRGWRQGRPGDGRRGSRDPWYCINHADQAKLPHIWDL